MGLLFDDSIPSERYEDGDYIEIDLTAELAEHLEDGEVAVLMESGDEKLSGLPSGLQVDLAFARTGVSPRF